jgi:hypothetical protein
MYSAFVRVDSTFVDGSIGNGVHLEGNRRALIARSTIRNTPTGVGAYANFVDTLSLVSDTIQNSGIGVLVINGVDSLRISRSLIAGNSQNGLEFESRAARVDSTVISGNLADGVLIGPSGGLRMRHSRIEANGTGVVILSGAAPLSVIRQSRIAGNTLLRGVFSNNVGITVLDADSVWWGDPAGPNCPIAVGSCPATGADSVFTGGVTFANPLAAVPPTPAPPAYRSIATAATMATPVRRASAVSQRQAPEPDRRTAARPPAPAPPRPTPGLSWQRGREPRPPAPPRER